MGTIVINLDTQDDDTIEAIRQAIEGMLGLGSVAFTTTTYNECDEDRDA